LTSASQRTVSSFYASNALNSGRDFAMIG